MRQLRMFGVVVVLALGVMSANAQDVSKDEKKDLPMGELSAAKLRLATAEINFMVERAERIKSDYSLIQNQIQQHTKTQDGILQEAAKLDGVDPNLYNADIMNRVWKKK